MKMAEAQAIIDSVQKSTGYMVTFEKTDGKFLFSDHFPDKAAGEDLIPTEAEAWNLARAFAAKTLGACQNIYVVDSNFRPTPSCPSNKIHNRI